MYLIIFTSRYQTRRQAYIPQKVSQNKLFIKSLIYPMPTVSWALAYKHTIPPQIFLVFSRYRTLFQAQIITALDKVKKVPAVLEFMF